MYQVNRQEVVMAVVIPLNKKKKIQKDKVKNLVINKDGKKQACYVLITCGEPNAEGKMQVEMTYEGEPILAAYLLENAQSILDDRLSI